MTIHKLLHDALKKDIVIDSAQPQKIADNGQFDFYSKRLAIGAATSIQQWAEEDASDLDSGENFADRLFALLIGVIDEDINGKLSSDQQEDFQEVREYAAQYMARLGVDSDDAESILNDWDKEAAERARDVVISNLPDGDESANDDINQFVFGTDSTAFDSATYRKMIAVRDGKKTIVKVRVSGHFTMSPAQIIALKKARLKSKTHASIRSRQRSLAMRKEMGVH